MKPAPRIVERGSVGRQLYRLLIEAFDEILEKERGKPAWHA